VPDPGSDPAAGPPVKKPPKPPLRPPPARRLRVYAFDPHASLDLGSARYSHATISLAWEDPTEEKLSPGPVNEYVEVIDIDPCSNQFYEPVDLNEPEVLAQDGLPPSEGDPRFHQQMVFAVVMKTIKLFERALGRKVIWRAAWDRERHTYVPTLKLRVYPHALREANAYYSPGKQALLFGYFAGSQRSAGAAWIFTALSHDIIVHETTHAILDGLHRRYSEATSLDSLAFHEAFADIAALFSHFQLYEAVYDFIDNQGGRLNQSSLLTGLAGQFAKGTTGRASLRDYIAEAPDPDLLERTAEPHARGAILVAAVFDAFLSIYTARTADLLRLSGTRLGTRQRLHPDLVARLTQEATKTADHVLRMCIRALDYLPPVDVRFGEFLRAIVTADADLIPDDRLHYRLAFVEAFRRRGIFPEDCLSMSPDNLLWEPPTAALQTDDILHAGLDLTPVYVRSEMIKTAERNRRKVWYWLTKPCLTVGGDPKSKATETFDRILSGGRLFFSDDATRSDEGGPAKDVKGFIDGLLTDLRSLEFPDAAVAQIRAELAGAASHFAQWELFIKTLQASTPRLRAELEVDRMWEDGLGIFFQPRPDRPVGILDDRAPGERYGGFPVEVHSVRTTRRAGPDGQDIRQLVIEVTQRRRAYIDPDVQARSDNPKPADPPLPKEDFIFRGGATLIIDLREYKLRYVIRKAIHDDVRLDAQRRLLLAPEGLGFTYNRASDDEPFALLHRH